MNLRQLAKSAIATGLANAVVEVGPELNVRLGKSREKLANLARREIADRLDLPPVLLPCVSSGQMKRITDPFWPSRSFAGLFLRASFYLCGDGTGCCDADYLRDLTLVGAIGVDESVGTGLRGLKSQDDSPVGFG